MPVARLRFRRRWDSFRRRFWTLLREPSFIVLTVAANGTILAGGVVLYLLERGVNPRMASLLDGIYWATQTITTVGYGDVVAVTPLGRLFSIVLMLGGSAVTVLYTALFAAALIAPEIRHVESKVNQLESSVRAVDDELAHEEAELGHVLGTLRSLTERLERSSRKK